MTGAGPDRCRAWAPCRLLAGSMPAPGRGREPCPRGSRPRGITIRTRIPCVLEPPHASRAALGPAREAERSWRIDCKARSQENPMAYRIMNCPETAQLELIEYDESSC